MLRGLWVRPVALDLRRHTLARSLTLVKRPANASSSSSVRLRGLPTPDASLMASSAWRRQYQHSLLQMSPAQLYETNSGDDANVVAEVSHILPKRFCICWHKVFTCRVQALSRSRHRICDVRQNGLIRKVMS